MAAIGIIILKDGKGGGLKKGTSRWEKKKEELGKIGLGVDQVPFAKASRKKKICKIEGSFSD